MRILAFSDWRIQPLGWLEEIVIEQQPDVILYAGDDTSRFFGPGKDILVQTQSDLQEEERPEAKDNFINKVTVPFYCVNGNDDTILVHDGKSYVRYALIPAMWGSDYQIDYPRSEFVPVAFNFGHFKISDGKDVATVFGVEATHGLQSDITNAPDRYADIFLTHIPPRGVLDLSVRFGIEHIGSLKLLRAIKKYKPRLVICGHSHIWGGFSSRIGETLVINVSSSDNDRYTPGCYALIDTSDWSVDLLTKEDLGARVMRMLRRMRDIREELENKTPNLYKDLRNVRTDEALLGILNKAENLGVNTSRLRRLREKIESFGWDMPRIAGQISIDPNEQAFVDVETGRAQGDKPGKLWLIGLWYQGEVHQFLIPPQRHEFVKYLRKNRIESLASWSQYDHKSLRSLLISARVKVEFKDALLRTSNHVIWHTYSLHELYGALFGKRETEPIGGFQAGLYADHLIIPNHTCRYCPPPSQIVKRIKERNKMDLIQMVEICKFLQRT